MRYFDIDKFIFGFVIGLIIILTPFTIFFLANLDKMVWNWGRWFPFL